MRNHLFVVCTRYLLFVGLFLGTLTGGSTSSSLTRDLVPETYTPYLVIEEERQAAVFSFRFIHPSDYRYSNPDLASFFRSPLYLPSLSDPGHKARILYHTTNILCSTFGNQAWSPYFHAVYPEEPFHLFSA